MAKSGSRHLAVCATTIALVHAMPAMAQDADGDASVTDEQTQAAQTTQRVMRPDEIVVTARRKEELLQDVPLAVTAVAPETLNRAQITNVSELSRVAPSLVSVPGQGGSRSLPNFAIRGLSQQELTILADPSVPVYLGDIVAARTSGVNGAIFDVGAVEILRGPQGTLFGRNATGGAIVIRPARPEYEFGARASVTVGNLDTFNIEGMINMPVADNVALRVAGIRKRDDGYVRDINLGRNVDYTAQEGARISLLLGGNGGFESLTSYDYFHEDDGGTPTFIKYANLASPFNAPATRAALGYDDLADLLAEQEERGIYEIANGLPAFTKVETHTIQNRTELAFSDAVTFRSILGFREIDSNTFDDVDGTSNSIHVIERIDEQQQLSSEVQFLGGTDRLDWIVGGYYFWEKGRNQGPSPIGAVDPGDFEDVDNAYDFIANVSNTDVGAINESYALFAQGTYELVNDLRLTLGFRYNWDKRRAIIQNRTETACRFTLDTDGDPTTPEVAVPLDQCRLDISDSFSEPTYNIGLEYRLDSDKMVYIAHRHGYRTGGYGARASSEEGLRRTFEPETVDDFELGLKADWHPGGMFLRTNLAGYYAKYNDIQRLLQDDSLIPPTTVTANAGKARIYGVEAEVLFEPVQDLELTANYAYTNTKFTDFTNPFDGTDLSGLPFARAPKNVYTLGARYTLPLDDDIGDISIGGSYYHTDGFNGSDSPAPPFTDVEGWNLVNMDLGWNGILGSGFDANFFVNNLLDEEYSYLLLNLQSLGYTSFSPGRPRTYGITLRARFGAEN